MILLGCLIAFGAAVAPRVVLVLAWIFADRWTEVWGGDILVPLLGILIAPYTTIMFMLAVNVTPEGNTLVGFDWVWIGLGILLDIWKWSGIFANRKTGYEYGSSIYKSSR